MCWRAVRRHCRRGGAEQVLHTAKQVFDEFKPGDHPSVERLEQLLRDIVHETHLVIKMNAVTTKTGAHASFVGLVLTPHGEAVWAHVGDSRLYHFPDGECLARTSDAAYVEHLISTDRCRRTRPGTTANRSCC
jgi:serine/threonine protein phosphatase PrpC